MQKQLPGCITFNDSLSDFMTAMAPNQP